MAGWSGRRRAFGLASSSETTRVSVIGGGRVVPDDAAYATAREIGRRCGRRGYDVVCGGRAGVMEAACRGASEAGGRTIGILPGEDPGTANPHVDVPIATGLGHARNPLVVMNGEAVIAVDGGVGTLSELGFAGVFERPTAGLGTHDVPGVEVVESPRAAVAFVESAVSERMVESDRET